jgi:hypothetical protein
VPLLVEARRVVVRHERGDMEHDCADSMCRSVFENTHLKIAQPLFPKNESHIHKKKGSCLATYIPNLFSQDEKKNMCLEKRFIT